VTGVRVGICVGNGGCASWSGFQVGFASWGGQVRVFKFGCSSWVFKSRCAGRVLSILGFHRSME
jgi:hypothetical protein